MAKARAERTRELISRLEEVVKSEFVRLTYTEGVEILKNSGRKFEFPVDWGTDLQSEHERYLVIQNSERCRGVLEFSARKVGPNV